MLGIELLPAVLYFFCLCFVPSSPRWQILAGVVDDAKGTLTRVVGESEAQKQLVDVIQSLEADKEKEKARLRDIFHPYLQLVLIIGVTLAVLQQITGINAVFLYAPIIFE